MPERRRISGTDIKRIKRWKGHDYGHPASVGGNIVNNDLMYIKIVIYLVIYLQVGRF